LDQEFQVGLMVPNAKFCVVGIPSSSMPVSLDDRSNVPAPLRDTLARNSILLEAFRLYRPQEEEDGRRDQPPRGLQSTPNVPSSDSYVVRRSRKK